MSEPEKHLRTPRKLSQIAVQSSQSRMGDLFFVFFAFFAVKSSESEP